MYSILIERAVRKFLLLTGNQLLSWVFFFPGIMLCFIELKGLDIKNVCLKQIQASGYIKMDKSIDML